jgi:spore germination cell wall hydrolase CwlJ-like protein
MLKIAFVVLQLIGMTAMAYANTSANIIDVTPTAEEDDSRPLSVDVTPTAEEDDSRPLSVDTRQELAPAPVACLAQAIYFEGGNQTVDGMEAIGHVIMNRVESTGFPDTICGVVRQGPRDGGPITRYRCQFTYFCDGKGDTFPLNDTPAELEAADAAWSTAELILTGATPDMTHGSDHYHANYVSPPWSQVYDLVATVDAHLFYTSN